MKVRNFLAVRIVSLLLCLVTVLAVFSPQISAAEFGAIDGTSAILIEPSSGEVLYEYNAKEQVMPASTTKVMTALLVIEAAKSGRISLDDEVAATQTIIDGVIFDASKVHPYIADGEIMTVRDYLYCVLLESDCVACDVLANYVSGSVEAFVAQMNTRASQLGCRNTLFLNSHGYPVDGHYSTAYDIALITAEAIKHDEFNEIFGTIKYTVPATNLAAERKICNTNWLIWNPEKIDSTYCKYYYEYATGGKTGSSTKSGHCLVSTAEKDGMTLICVITGCKIANPSEGQWWNMSFVESARLFEWGFENFSHSKAVRRGGTYATINIKKSEIEEMGLVAAQEVSLTIPVGSEGFISTEVIVYNETVKAPVSAGDVMGEIKVMYRGEQVTSVNLIASRDAEVKKGISPLLLILILIIIAVAGIMLYVVNNDEPVIFKKYKPYSTYKDKSKYNSSEHEDFNISTIIASFRKWLGKSVRSLGNAVSSKSTEEVSERKNASKPNSGKESGNGEAVRKKISQHRSAKEGAGDRPRSSQTASRSSESSARHHQDDWDN